jgi:hypothetical protein
MSRKSVVVVGFAVAVLCSAASAQMIRVGSEFQANGEANSLPSVPVTASGPSGEFVVVWLSKLPSESVTRILGRRFSSFGVTIGSEFQINAGSVSAEAAPAVAADAEGDFIVAWNGAVGAAPAAFARRFTSSGASLGTEFRVDSYAVDSGPTDVDVAVAAAGDFLVVWSDLGINGRRFSSVGAPLGSQFRISATLNSGETGPDVAADGGGNFVVVWVDGVYSIEGRRLAADGSPLGAEFQVDYAPYSEYGPYIQVDEPVVAAGGGGNFVVAWEKYVQPANDSAPSRADIMVRAYDSFGNPQGAGFKVTGAPHYYYNPAIAASASGEFIVAWDGFRDDGTSYNVNVQRFDAGGSEIGDKFIANATLAGEQVNAAVAASGDGGFVVAWSQNAPANRTDVRGQRFATKLTTPICDGGVIAGRAQLKLSKLGAPAGDEKLLMKGAFFFPPGSLEVFDPLNAGAQILIEDLGSGGASLLDLSHQTQAVPGGGGCGATDGWQTNDSRTAFKYKNKSGALPQACTAGSALGLSMIKLNDKRMASGEITFKLKVKKATIAAPVGPLRVSLVFGAGALESGNGECGVAEFADTQCWFVESTFVCQLP